MGSWQLVSRGELHSVLEAEPHPYSGQLQARAKEWFLKVPGRGSGLARVADGDMTIVEKWTLLPEKKGLLRSVSVVTDESYGDFYVYLYVPAK